MRFLKVLLWKAYFDKGFSLLNYVKYIIAFFGLASGDVRTTIIISIVFAVACLITGRLWFHFRLIDTEHEINNMFNPFCHDMRQAVKKSKI